MKWLALHMPREKYDVTFVFLYHKEPALHAYLLEREIASVYIRYNGKYDLPRIIFQLFKLFKKIKPHIVHPHLFEASIAGIIAASLAGVPVILYTRHHASLHHDNFPNAVKYDRWLNKNAQKIIAISENVKTILIDQDKADPEKVVLVHHGFDFSEFVINVQEIEKLKKKYNLGNHHPVVGVISRFTHFKGVQYIIPAFKELLKKHPDAVLVLANAIGDYRSTIIKLLEDLPVASYRLIEFEQNVFALYRCFDVFVHTPINMQVEAFGQIYIEAMALEVPVVCTLSGIAFEFIKDRDNAIVAPFCDSHFITVGMEEILGNSTLRNEMVAKANSAVVKLFDVKQMIDKYDNLYRSMLAERQGK